MRIIHILEATLGGTRRYVNDLFSVSHPENEHLFVYGSARADNAFRLMLKDMERAGWQTQELDLRRDIRILHDIACARRLREIVKGFSPDVIHAHSSKAGAIARFALIGLPNRPSVIYSPNAIAVHLGFVYNLVEHLLGPQTQILAAISASERDELEGMSLVPPNRLRIIVPTIRSAEFVPTERQLARNTLGFANTPIVVGIGRLTLQKNPLSFVRVIQALRVRQPDARGIWVGDGEMRSEVERAIVDAGLTNAVTIAGWKDDVRPYLAACDVFLSTAAYESFGYVTAEALAMDRPAVASAITGTIDILTLDRDRVLYEPGNEADAAAKIDALLTDPDLAREVASRGRTRILQAFSPDATRECLDDAIQAALDIRGRNVWPHPSTKNPRVVIVSDPLVQRGGAERVVEAIANIFPKAPIFALLYSAETGPAKLRERVISSRLSWIPSAAKRHRFLLPFYPAAIESFDVSAFDIIISSHHTVAKGIIRSAEATHVCYCHTPMRALWERTHDELATLPVIIRPLIETLFRILRVWDVATVPRVDLFLANSKTTQQRIKKHYGRDSVIVYPPIDTARFTPSGNPPGDYYLVASRLVPYKRVELALDAARRVERRLIIVGDGPGRAALLRRGAELFGHVTDSELIELMQGARALIFPQNEDFGMTPIEMMACGRPIIAYNRGGAAETVIDGETGVLVDEQTPEAFANGIRRLETLTISADACRRQAERFSQEHFVQNFTDAVFGAYNASRKSSALT